jgi:hypothetical protein
MTKIEDRLYTTSEARMAVATWFSDRHGSEAVDRLRAFVALATSDRTTMLAEVREAELPDLLGALMLMQQHAA